MIDDKKKTQGKKRAVDDSDKSIGIQSRMAAIVYALGGPDYEKGRLVKYTD